jgi:hypothetical protein
MGFETGLVNKLQEISGLKVFPDFAQEGTATPYIIYTRDNTEYERVIGDINPTLDGVTYELNLIVDKKSECESYGTQVESKLRELYATTTGGKYIQDIDILKRFTQWESEIEKYREIIEFTVYY